MRTRDTVALGIVALAYFAYSAVLAQNAPPTYQDDPDPRTASKSSSRRRCDGHSARPAKVTDRFLFAGRRGWRAFDRACLHRATAHVAGA